MYSKVLSGTVHGVDGCHINVEVDVSNGLPVFEMVGYLGAEVREAKERVRTALRNSGFPLPVSHITVNLSPANLHKEGSTFDLAIAVAILVAMEIISPKVVEEYVILGELSLSGEVRSVNGVLPILSHAQKQGVKKALVPASNSLEGAVLSGMEVYGVSSLAEVVRYINNKPDRKEAWEPSKVNIEQLFTARADTKADFSEIAGQAFAKRGLEIAAAGFHNLLMVGPPGAGKSMLARCIPSILPALTLEESIDITKIYSVKGLLKEQQALITSRPFRSPHHTLSPAALSGGGSIPVPGEMSLAHNGVLFLDELPEFKREVLEVMRQPLEDKKLTLSRVHASYTFPADFMLVAAMNPCPCGYFPDRRRCHCSDSAIRRYLSKVSQPLLDRIDLCVETAAVPIELLRQRKKEETSIQIQKRVTRAHERQRKRYYKEEILFNSQLSVRQMKQFCTLTSEEEAFLLDAVKQYQFSARAYHRVLRVARTIADLAGKEQILKEHLCEALAYHNGNLKYWNVE